MGFEIQPLVGDGSAPRVDPSAAIRRGFIWKSPRVRVSGDDTGSPLFTWIAVGICVHLFAGLLAWRLAPASSPVHTEPVNTELQYEVELEGAQQAAGSSKFSDSASPAARTRAAAPTQGTQPQARAGTGARAGAGAGSPEAGGVNGGPRLLSGAGVADAEATNDGSGPRLLVGGGVADGNTAEGSKGATSRLLSSQGVNDASSPGPTRPMIGDGAHLTGLRFDRLARCALDRGGTVSITLASGRTCHFSAKHRGWTDCSGQDAATADAKLGSLCR